MPIPRRFRLRRRITSYNVCYTKLLRGDRVRAFIAEVKMSTKGPQIILSRTHPGLVATLFYSEVPEIAEGIVEIKGVAREPGSRAKIAVVSHDPDVDPVGACVGMRGSRVSYNFV